MARRAADWDGYHESPRPNPTKGISRTTTVREPLPSVVVPLVWAAIHAVVGLGMLMDLVLEGLSHEHGWTFGVIVVVLILVARAFRDNARLYRRRIIEREQMREKNFWRVMNLIINDKLPAPSPELAALENQIAQHYEAMMRKQGKDSRGRMLPDPNSRRSQKKRERAERRRAAREMSTEAARISEAMIHYYAIPNEIFPD
jgi:hypothetical protein